MQPADFQHHEVERTEPFADDLIFGREASVAAEENGVSLRAHYERGPQRELLKWAAARDVDEWWSIDYGLRLYLPSGHRQTFYTCVARRVVTDTLSLAADSPFLKPVTVDPVLFKAADGFSSGSWSSAAVATPALTPRFPGSVGIRLRHLRLSIVPRKLARIRARATRCAQSSVAIER
jgi:hypothetical protein